MILDDFNLTGKCGIVTGGGNGIGKGITKGLTEAGARVLIAGRNLDKLEKTAAEFNAAGLGRVVCATVDMSKPESISALVETALRELGQIDFLFNNAGTIYREPCEKFPPDVWEHTLAVNLSGPFYLSQHVARHMIERGKGGSIVNTSSMAAVFGGKTVPAYAATKGGLTQVTKTMCNDWSRYGIRANAIGPGWVRTELTQPLFDDKQGRYKEITARIPMDRWAEPEEFAGPAVFLVSDASSYINGHVLFVDGGYLAM